MSFKDEWRMRGKVNQGGVKTLKLKKLTPKIQRGVEVGGGVKKRKQPTCENLDEAKEDDDEERQQLGGGEQVLNFGRSSHADAVHKGQRGCRGRKTWQDGQH